VGYRRLVDGRVFVGFEVDEGVVRDALGGGFSYSQALWLAWILTGRAAVRFPVPPRQDAAAAPGHRECGAGSLRTAIKGTHCRLSVKRRNQGRTWALDALLCDV
jgi:hypothetical protein